RKCCDIEVLPAKRRVAEILHSRQKDNMGRGGEMGFASSGMELVAESQAVPARGRLARRSCCPGCGSSAVTVVVSEPYSSEALSGYVERHDRGRAEPAALAGSTYALARCTQCSLGYQVTVPDPELLEAVYERWI